MATSSRRSDSKTISAIFFDLDNTLIPTRRGDRIACYKVQNILVDKYGFSLEDASDVTQAFLKNFRKCPENPEFSLHDWRLLLWKKSLGENHVEISGEIYYQWLNLRYKYLKPSPEVISLLESLRKNYLLAVITNGPSNSQWEKIKRLQLSDYFHLILVSGDLKWEKPSDKIFLEACAYLGVPADKCIMVGDKLETDILGGAKAGLGGTVWVSPPEPLMDSAGGSEHANVVPDCVVDDVTQLKIFLSSKMKMKRGDFGLGFLSMYFGVNDSDAEDCSSDGS